jgi:tRNA dimethylallyltransferase
MLYFRALSQGLAELPSADRAVREAIEAQARRDGWQALHERLAVLDPEIAARIHPNDPQRIQRALEVIELSGRRMSEMHERQPRQGLPYRVLRIVACPQPRSVLHARIEQRFRLMLEQGFLDELRALRARGDLHRDLPSMRCVGYRQAWSHLDGEIDCAEMCRQAIAATRQLAKRQLTWLRRESAALWYDPGMQFAQESVFGQIAEFLEL